MAERKTIGVETIQIHPVETELLEVWVLGTSPLITNKMAEKGMRTILLPSGRMTQADKQTNLKHNPVAEFRASPYRLSGKAETLLALPTSAFKGAMMTAALDLPGAKKAQIGRLCTVLGDYTPLYGTPQLHMAIVRSADIQRTPDVRTRAILPTWACKVRVTFVTPLLNAQSVINLISAGGVTSGIGDWRPEKGKGSYGQYRVVNADDPELLEIILKEGRIAQEKALETPVCYNDEAQELLDWWNSEIKRRGVKSVA